MAEEISMNLFDDPEFNIQFNKNKSKAKDLIKHYLSEVNEAEIDTDKLLKGKNISIEDRLYLIKEKVLKVLGKQRKNVEVIRDKETLDRYIDAAIEAGRIDIDTETNNSLDPVTCKLMGPCFYYPGGKQAYVPINHVDYRTEELLPNQLTEKDIGEAIKRINESNIDVIMHNGKFDYEVITCTCGIKPNLYWDTMVAARLLNENEEAGLKAQYRKYIDPAQEKYDIDKLFTNIPYAYVDPEIFALYAATDSMMTDKLYLYQKPLMEAEGPHLDSHGREVKGVNWLFHNVEMPIVIVTAEMEMRGIFVDVNLGARLHEKYTQKLEELDNDIAKTLNELKPVIRDWRLSKEATQQSKQFEPKKSKKSLKEIEAAYPLFDKVEQKRYKLSKPKADQLPDDINLGSPVQLAILMYDVLKCKQVSDNAPRGTGEEEMKKISEYFAKMADKAVSIDISEDMSEDDIEALEASVRNAAKDENNTAVLTKQEYQAADKLCSAIMERRGIMKLLTTYIDTIPTLTKHWTDGRVRVHYNSLGTDTGRYSSGGKLKFNENGEELIVSGLNMQNIPSRAKNIRLLFKAKTIAKINEANADDNFIVDEADEIELESGWKYGKDITVGEKIIVDGVASAIKNITYDSINKSYCIEV